MIAAIHAELPLAPPDVLDFAAQQELSASLGPILTATRNVFPGCSIALRLELDAEIESDQYIVIDVDVSGWSTEEMFSARNRWSEEFCRVSPSKGWTVFQVRLMQKP